MSAGSAPCTGHSVPTPIHPRRTYLEPFGLGVPLEHVADVFGDVMRTPPEMESVGEDISGEGGWSRHVVMKKLVGEDSEE
jgi:hypothetical protein